MKTSKREMLTRPSRNDHESGRAFVRGAGPLLHRIALGFAASLLACVTALAQPPLWPMDQWRYPNSGLRDVPPPPAETEPDPADTIPPHLRRQVVNYATREMPGTIVIDTAGKHLYLVQAGQRALRYGIGVGRPGCVEQRQEMIPGGMRHLRHRVQLLKTRELIPAALADLLPHPTFRKMSVMLFHHPAVPVP